MKLSLILFCSALVVLPAKAAGPETVDIIHVSNPVFGVDCKYKAQGCAMALKYATTYKRKDGTSGIVLLPSRTITTKMVINFCRPVVQGGLEKPCSQNRKEY